MTASMPVTYNYASSKYVHWEIHGILLTQCTRTIMLAKTTVVLPARAEVTIDFLILEQSYWLIETLKVVQHVIYVVHLWLYTQM